MPHIDSDSRVTSFVITTDLQSGTGSDNCQTDTCQACVVSEAVSDLPDGLPDRCDVMMSAFLEMLTEPSPASIRP